MRKSQRLRPSGQSGHAHSSNGAALRGECAEGTASDLAVLAVRAERRTEGRQKERIRDSFNSVETRDGRYVIGGCREGRGARKKRRTVVLTINTCLYCFRTPALHTRGEP